MAAMIAIRKITAPSRSCNRRPVWPTRCIITAPSNTVRVRAANSHQPICNAVAARCNAVLSAYGATSIGFMPSLNNTALNTAKITSRAASFQLARSAEIRRHTPMSIKISARAHNMG